jgi:hypothetical protein
MSKRPKVSMLQRAMEQRELEHAEMVATGDAIVRCLDCKKPLTDKAINPMCSHCWNVVKAEDRQRIFDQMLEQRRACLQFARETVDFNRTRESE